METYKHKMDTVNILRGFTDCLTFPFSNIYKATFYHDAAQIHVYLKRVHQVLDNTHIQFELSSSLLYRVIRHFYCLQWPPLSAFVAGHIKQLLTREALATMRYSPENINIDRDDTKVNIDIKIAPLYNLKHKFKLRALSLVYDRKS